MPDVYFPVRSDLRRILLGTPGLPTAVHWEGRKFSPVTGLRWIAEKLEPAASVEASIASIGYTYETMVYMITLNDPPETVAVSDTENMIDAICYQFPVGRRVGSANIFGNVVRSTRRGMITGPDWRSVMATVTFFVLKPNVA